MNMTIMILSALLLCASNLPAQIYNFQQQEKKQEENNKQDKPKDEPEKSNQKELEEKACGLTEVNYTARTDKNQRPIPEPPPGKAIIYVIRPTMMGNKIQSKLAVNGEWKGANRGNNYFYLELSPGEYHFCSKAENRSLLTLKVEAGKTYYLQQKIQMALMKARDKLVALDTEEGEAGLANPHFSLAL